MEGPLEAGGQTSDQRRFVFCVKKPRLPSAPPCVPTAPGSGEGGRSDPRTARLPAECQSFAVAFTPLLNEAAGAAVMGSLADSGGGEGKNIGGKSRAQPPGWTPYEY